MQVKLVYFRPDGSHKLIDLPKTPAVIGRGDDCAVRAPVGGVSRRHCEIIADGDSLAVRDLESSNGTYVNGSRISQADLKPGDMIKLGELVLAVQINGQPEKLTAPAAKVAKPAKAVNPAKAAAASEDDSANVDDFISMMFDDDEDDDEIDPIKALEDMDDDI